MLQHMAKDYTLGCWIFCLGLLGIGCGLPPAPAPNTPRTTAIPATFAETRPTVAPLFVILSGWNTCQTNSIYGSYSPYHSGMYLPYTALARKVQAQTGFAPKLVLTCFGKTSSFYYVLGQDDTPRYDSHEAIFSVINKLHGGDKRTPVFVMGHSHGGWLAMHVVARLGQTLAPRRLYTIDPISRTECTPSVMTWAYFESAFSLSPAAGCIRNPADFSATTRKQIRASVGQWTHFYQSDYPMLHSSYQEFAHKNIMLQFGNSAWFAYRAHMQIAADPRVWHAIEMDVLRDLQ